MNKATCLYPQSAGIHGITAPFCQCLLWENMHSGARNQNSTCTHRRWFQVRRGPDVCVVRPSHGLHAWAGIGPSPSSRSPGDCPCWQAVGRKLDPAYLCESACHWWHGLFTELRRWGEFVQPHWFIEKTEYNWNVLSLNYSQWNETRKTSVLTRLKCLNLPGLNIN